MGDVVVVWVNLGRSKMSVMSVLMLGFIDRKWCNDVTVVGDVDAVKLWLIMVNCSDTLWGLIGVVGGVDRTDKSSGESCGVEEIESIER